MYIESLGINTADSKEEYDSKIADAIATIFQILVENGVTDEEEIGVIHAMVTSEMDQIRATIKTEARKQAMAELTASSPNMAHLLRLMKGGSDDS